MSIDVRDLTQNQACQILNATPLGEVATPHIIRNHVSRAGLKIGDGKRIDLLKYAAWLFGFRDEVQEKYDKHREQSAERERERSTRGREIGPLPEVKDPARRARCAESLRDWMEVYFPDSFPLQWSAAHLDLIDALQDVIYNGGAKAFAMSRGSGKTTMTVKAAEWGVFGGHLEMVTLIGSNEPHALMMLDAIRTDLETNDLLLEDWPEVCYPIRRLEGINQRRLLLDGYPLTIGFTNNKIILPDVPGAASAENCIGVAGLTGQIRGQTYTRRDGRTVRPSAAILDDPQTDESANSAQQTAKREEIIRKAVLGLPGPGKKLSVIMPCTIIAKDDLAERFLDRQRNPQWHGTRTQMLNGMPTAVELWDRYFQMRADSLRREEGTTAATEFYRAHQAEMDAGCEASWSVRYNSDEISAIQHAMNRKHDLGDAAFFAECQNSPLATVNDDAALKPAEIGSRLNRLPRGTVPEDATHVTAFIDVQGKLLYWLVAAWRSDFTGAILDYGTYPDQRKAYFLLRDAGPTLADAAPGAGLEGSIHAGLTALASQLCGREWRRPDGSAMRLSRVLVDSGWSTDVIYAWCRQSAHANIIAPSKGWSIKASQRPMAAWDRKPGEQAGDNWVYGYGPESRVIRRVLIDVNHWKTFVAARLQAAPGDPGAMSLFGDSQEAHRLLCDHLSSEYRVQTSGQGRQLDEWKMTPGRENHWWDCLVGAAVAASMCGVQVRGGKVVAKKPEPFRMPRR